MKKWEYMIADFRGSDLKGESIIDYLNKAGKDGWEAFSGNYAHLPTPATSPDLIIVLFKRELEE